MKKVSYFSMHWSSPSIAVVVWLVVWLVVAVVVGDVVADVVADVVRVVDVVGDVVWLLVGVVVGELVTVVVRVVVGVVVCDEVAVVVAVVPSHSTKLPPARNDSTNALIVAAMASQSSPPNRNRPAMQSNVPSSASGPRYSPIA